jgi:2-polyprenyl-6-methoxyphenol hydroxylase-like FAD-dependent oxidoreductase
VAAVSTAADVEIFRDDLAALLLGATQGEVEYIYGDSVARIDESDESVEVAFEQSAPRAFDLVIGADGLHSNVRRLASATRVRFCDRSASAWRSSRRPIC